jgi:hypothetical protein
VARAAFEVAAGDAGAQHVDAVEGGFGGDGVLVAGVAEVVLADVGPEVLADLAAAQRPVGAQRDLVLAAQRLAGPPGGCGDRGQVGLGGGQQRFPLAGLLGFQERVVAGHQPLAGVVRMGDLGQVQLTGQGELERAVADQCLDLRARSAVIQSSCAGPTSSRSRAVVSMPRSPASTTWAIPNRFLILSTWAATVFGSPVLPLNTSIATGMPSLLVSSPQAIWSRPRTPSLGCPMAASGQVRPSNAADETS